MHVCIAVSDVSNSSTPTLLVVLHRGQRVNLDRAADTSSGFGLLSNRSVTLSRSNLLTFFLLLRGMLPYAHSTHSLSLSTALGYVTTGVPKTPSCKTKTDHDGGIRAASPDCWLGTRSFSRPGAPRCRRSRVLRVWQVVGLRGSQLKDGDGCSSGRVTGSGSTALRWLC